MTSLRSLASLPLFGVRPGSVVGASSLMGLFSRSAGRAPHRVTGQPLDGRVRARDGGRDADAVVRRAAHGKPRELGDLFADAGHARVVADRVLGQAVGPAGDAGVEGRGGEAG